MCGIIGIIGKDPVAGPLLDALKRLEYRGYDSAGIATLINGDIERRRAEGKLENLVSRIQSEPIAGTTGIGHTRWATHGVPNEKNAHPHATKSVAVVHNGIIENFQVLRDELAAVGHVLASDTDTEVVVHLITLGLERGDTPAEATKAALARLEGAFALGIVFAGEDDLMIAARQGSPLAIGIGDGEMYLGSDAIALAPLTSRIMYLEDGDWAVINAESVTVYGEDGRKAVREVRETELSGDIIGKGGYEHFMLKEIYEQPQVIGDTLHSFVNPAQRSITLPDFSFDPAEATKFTLIACGTSYYACLVAKYWLETLARVPVEADIASEFRYRDPVLEDGGLALFISQSGETADTLAALRHCKENGQTIGVIVNVPTSSMAREADLLLPTHAGPEIGVASTKAFACQLAVLAALAAHMAVKKGLMSRDEEQEVVRHLLEAPACLNAALDHDDDIASMAHLIAPARDVLYLGRGPDYPMALEGALKLKEISYIHAEGYASGEMKHGPIALIDDKVPVIVLAPSGPLFEKTVSNMEEVRARGGQVVLISDADGLEQAGEGCLATIEMPKVHPLIAPLVYAVPVQLLAYHVACVKGTDVDQPRNLAKSVTVE